MPQYVFNCGAGHSFEQRAGYDIEIVACACGEVARRAPFYRSQGVVVNGRSLPLMTDTLAVQDEWFKEVKKAGWTGERAVEGLRASVVEDKEGRRFIDTSKMPKES